MLHASRGSSDFVVGNRSNIIDNLLRQSEVENGYIYESAIFSLCEWGARACGLIDPGDAPRTDYDAQRMEIRGLQGRRATCQSTCSNADMLSITTKDGAGHYRVLFTATGSAVTATLDMGALLTTCTGTIWQFDASHNDVVAGNPVLSYSKTTLSVAANAGYPIEF